MPLYKNDPVLARLIEKVRLVEKSGQTNTVHHENLKNYLATLQPKKAKPPYQDKKEVNDGE